jgi:hypothetical protein
MTPDIAMYNKELQRRIDRICAAVDGLTAQELNWRPPVPESNSVYVIATHTLGNIRAWVLGICCGQPIDRDRAAEFRSEGDDPGELIDRGRALQREVEDALSKLDASTLDDLREARQRLWGAGTAEPVTGREAILHAIEHAAEHLGHIGLTKDLARAAT